MDKYLASLAFVTIVISLIVFSVFYFTGGRPAEVLPTLPGLSWLEQLFGPPSFPPPEDPSFGDGSGNGSGGGGGSGGDGSGGGSGDGSSISNGDNSSDGDQGDDTASGGGPGDEGGNGGGDNGGDDPGGGGNPPIDWGSGFDFPPGAVFPQEYLGEWEVYSLFGEEEARYLFLSFYPGGEFAFDKMIIPESEIGEGSQITETDFDMGSEETQNINIPDYWWVTDYANGSGTLFIYYDQILTENYDSMVSTETLSLNGIDFIKIES